MLYSYCIFRDDVVENGHALTNMISEEDIIPVDRIENEGGISALPGVTNNVGNSKPQDKVYIQTACKRLFFNLIVKMFFSFLAVISC